MSKYSDNTNSQNNFQALIKEIKGNLETHFKGLLSKMFIDADEELFDLADNAPSNEEQHRLFELMRVLREDKQEITINYLENLNLLLRPFAETGESKKKSTVESEDELSLVGQDEMDDMVLIKSIGGDAAGRFREAISHLEARLEHLALKTPDIFDKKALNPINICQAFDDALNNRFHTDNKKLVFQLFENNVVTKLDTIYDAINNLLIDAEVLPQIKLHAKKSASKLRPGHSPEDFSHDEGGEGDEAINQGGYAMTATPGHSSQGARHPGSGGRTGASSGGSYSTHGTGAGGGAAGMSEGGPGGDGGGAAGMGEGGPGGDGGGAAGMGEGGSGGAAGMGSGGAVAGLGEGGAESGTSQPGNYHHNTAGMPASQVSDVISKYMGSPLAPPSHEEGVASESYPAATPQYYGHDDVLTALSNIQVKPEFSRTGELKFDAEAIKQAVLSEIAKTSGGVVTKRINNIAEKTIDFIELIFDAIIEDDDISDTIKALLLRLQIPVIKASMVDQEFFIYDDHPARVLLDKIAEVGIGVTEHNDEVYIELDRIITKLVNEFELQTSSFQEALDDIYKYIDEREEAAQKQEEETQHQVLREHARNTVLKSLRSTTTGKILPESIHPLVLKRWPTLMYNHYLNHGKENDEWITILETLRDIINSVQPLKNATELNNLLDIRDELLETTQHYLKRTTHSKQDIETVIQGLKDIYQQHIDHADFSSIEAEPIDETGTKVTTEEEQETEQAAVAEPVITEPEPTGPQLPTNIMPGMWFQVYMGEDRALRRGKLSVIIAQDSKLVFVNYQGGIIVEKSFEEFTDELEQGQSKVIMGHSAFDHALSRVVTNLDTYH